MGFRGLKFISVVLDARFCIQVTVLHFVSPLTWTASRLPTTRNQPSTNEWKRFLRFNNQHKATKRSRSS